MKEYTIYHRHGTAKPYMMNIYKDILSAKMELYDIISLEEERGRPYFVENDFFNNKYMFCSDLYCLSILEREVTDWQKYDEALSNQKENNKIVFLNNFRKKA